MREIIKIPVMRGVYLASYVEHKWDNRQKKHLCTRSYYVGQSENCAMRLQGHRAYKGLSPYTRLVVGSLASRILSKSLPSHKSPVNIDVSGAPTKTTTTVTRNWAASLSPSAAPH